MKILTENIAIPCKNIFKLFIQIVRKLTDIRIPLRYQNTVYLARYKILEFDLTNFLPRDRTNRIFES